MQQAVAFGIFCYFLDEFLNGNKGAQTVRTYLSNQNFLFLRNVFYTEMKEQILFPRRTMSLDTKASTLSHLNVVLHPGEDA